MTMIPPLDIGTMIGAPGIQVPPGLAAQFMQNIGSAAQVPGGLGPSAAYAANPRQLSGLLGRASSGPVAQLFGGSGRMATIAKSPLGRVAGPIGLGYAASGFVDQLYPGSNSGMEQGLQGAAIGAGIGTAIAPGVGTVIGGAGGFLAGAASDFFFGKKSVNLSDEIEKAAKQFGLTPIFYTSAYNARVKAGEDKKLVAQEVVQAMQTDAQTQMQAKEAERAYKYQREADAKYALALQAQTQQFFAPITDNIMSSGAAQAATLSDLARQLPPQYAAVFEAQAANALSNTQRIAAAYAGQAGLLPQQSMMSADLARQAELAKYQWQTQVIQSQQGGTGDQAFADLAQQLSGQQ